MQLSKTILLSICISVFRFSFYLTVIAITVVLSFGSSQHVKEALEQTDAYKRIVPAIIEENISAKQSTTLPLEDKKVQEIILSSFSSEFLQRNTEEVVDSVYAWLHGETAKPEFVVDLGTAINPLAAKLSSYGFDRLKAQPVCVLNPSDINPFTATCRPKNFDFAAEQQLLESEIRDKSFLPKTTLSVADLPKNEQGKTLLDTYSYAPVAFQWLQRAPWILAQFTVLSAVLVIFLMPKKRAGVSLVGSSIASSSVFIVLSPLFFLFVLPRFFPALQVQAGGGGTKAVMSDVSSRLSAEFNTQLIYTGLALVVVGLLIVLAERAMRPKSKYTAVDKKSGLASSEAPHHLGTSAKLDPKTVPLVSSEGIRDATIKQAKDKKYRTIPTKEL